MTIIRVRRGTAAQWTASNRVLALGELGLETDTHKLKGGDGVTAWSSLPYISSGGGGGGGGGGNSWGSITGSLSSQTDLQSALNAKADDSEITLLQAEIDTKADASSVPIMATTQINIPRTHGGRFEHSQVITDANVSPLSKISISLGSMGDSDENEAEFIDLEALTATAGSGNFTAIASFKTKTAGIINLNYIIGA